MASVSGRLYEKVEKHCKIVQALLLVIDLKQRFGFILGVGIAC